MSRHTKIVCLAPVTSYERSNQGTQTSIAIARARDRGHARDDDINIPFIPLQPTSLRHYPPLFGHSVSPVDRLHRHLDRIDRASHDAATASTREMFASARAFTRAVTPTATERRGASAKTSASARPNWSPGSDVPAYLDGSMPWCVCVFFVWANSVISIRDSRFAPGSRPALDH